MSPQTPRTQIHRVGLTIVFGLLALALIPAALAGGGKSRSGSCTRSAPGVSVDNNYGWSQWGSWGMPGQQLEYVIQVRNYDRGCRSSSFSVSVTSPSGFSVSMPASTVSLRSGKTGYLSAYVTSPSASADGDYPLTVRVARVGAPSGTSSFTTSYKVYSSDTTAPTLFWSNPGPGQTISGRTYGVTVSSSDDHAVKDVKLYMDGVYMSTADCDNIAYTCQLYYEWSVGAPGQHTVRFEATDWMGNVGVQTVAFTVA